MKKNTMWLVLLLMLRLPDSGLEQSETHPVAPAEPVPGKSCPGNPYLGHYDDGGYDIGLFVCLDSESKTGTSFLPPSMESLSDVRWTSDGHVSFAEDSVRPVHVYFDGKATGLTIEGTIKQANAETKEVQETHVKLSLIEKLEPGTKEGGWYSGARYAESGDLVGADMVLWSANGALTGVMGFYVGYWGEPDFVPLFVSNMST